MKLNLKTMGNLGAPILGLGLATAILGQNMVQPSSAIAQTEPIWRWYNCYTREVFTPEKQAWCDRWQTLQSANYIVPTSLAENASDADYTTVTLDNGRYQSPNGDLFVELVNQAGWMTFGDLDGDGQDDAVVIFGVALDPEGEEIATYLSAVLDIDGEAQALTPVRLGERIMLNGPLGITNDQIILLPFMSITQTIDRYFTLEGDRLMEQPPSEPYGTMITEPTTADHLEPLENTLWHLISYRDAAGELMPAQTFVERPSIRFSAGQVNGNVTCNRIFSRYLLDGDSLSIQPGGTTLMGCPPEFMAQEQQVLRGLAQVAGYRLETDELQLLDADDNLLLVFTRSVSPALTDTLWQLITYNNGRDALVSVLAGTSITATFDASGGVTGFAGCNNYIASYTVAEDAIAIGPGVSTRKFCAQPDGVMEQETEFLRALETVANYTIEGNTLTLRSDTGATVAQFRTTDIVGD